MNFTTPPTWPKSPEYQVNILDRVRVEVALFRLAPAMTAQLCITTMTWHLIYIKLCCHTHLCIHKHALLHKYNTFYTPLHPLLHRYIHIPPPECLRTLDTTHCTCFGKCAHNACTHVRTMHRGVRTTYHAQVYVHTTCWVPFSALDKKSFI